MIGSICCLSFQCHIEHVYIDREENNVWSQKYRYDIPVLHLNGKFLMKHKVLSGALEEAIENAMAGSSNERLRAFYCNKTRYNCIVFIFQVAF